MKTLKKKKVSRQLQQRSIDTQAERERGREEKREEKKDRATKHVIVEMLLLLNTRFLVTFESCLSTRLHPTMFLGGSYKGPTTQPWCGATKRCAG